MNFELFHPATGVPGLDVGTKSYAAGLHPMSIDLSPSEQLAFTTVRIECDTPAGRSTGTGFYFAFCRKNDQFVPAIVTNKHVVAGSTAGRFHVHLAENPDSVPTTHMGFELLDFEKQWIGHPSADVDLCVMPIAPLLRFSEQQGKKLFFGSSG